MLNLLRVIKKDGATVNIAHGSEKVALSGLLTVGSVIAGRAALLAALERSDDIVVELSSTTNIDVSGVQLIDAARLHAMQAGKRLSLAAPADGRLRDMLQAGGFLETPDTRAFWLREGASL